MRDFLPIFSLGLRVKAWTGIPTALAAGVEPRIRVASLGSCFIERPNSTVSPQANKRCPRSKTLIAPTTSA